MRVCSRCGSNEEKVSFEKNRKICNSCRNKVAEWAKNNPERNAAQSKKWRELNPEKAAMMVRRANLKRLYGITLEQYNEMLEKQEYKCAVCKRPQSDFPRNFAVDHDHKENFVRGLLCTNCNHRIVGRHRDIGLLRAAADYLENPTVKWIIPPKKKKKRVKRVSRTK